MFVHHFILRKSCCHISTSANCQFISFLQTHIYYSYVFCLLLISLYIDIKHANAKSVFVFEMHHKGSMSYAKIYIFP